MGDINKSHQSSLRLIGNTSDFTKLDLTGDMVEAHNNLIELANTAQCAMLPLLEGCITRTKVFKNGNEDLSITIKNNIMKLQSSVIKRLVRLGLSLNFSRK